MRILYRYIVREHLGPFALSLAVLTFLFLMNELILMMEMVIGKGIQVDVVLEFLVYNIAWMLALTVPLAVLVSVLIAFGRFSRDGEITAMRASGLSVIKMVTPALIMGGVLFVLHFYFTDRILPEFNHNLSNLKNDIRMMRPNLALRSGVFMEEVRGYHLYIDSIDQDGSRVEGVNILHFQHSNYTDPPAIIQAEWGIISFDQHDETLNLDLRDGTITEVQSGQSRIQTFDRLLTFIDFQGTKLFRRETDIRGDRELPISALRERAAVHEERAMRYTEQLTDISETFLRRVVAGGDVELPGIRRPPPVGNRIQLRHRELRDQLDDLEEKRLFQLRERNRYLVELQKKYSIPFACIAFVLIGIPLALMARSGGAMLGFGYALIFYLLYWVFLVVGEYFGDRGRMAPWLAMWLPNILVTIAGIVLLFMTVKEQRFIRWSLLAERIPGRPGKWLSEHIKADV